MMVIGSGVYEIEVDLSEDELRLRAEWLARDTAELLGIEERKAKLDLCCARWEKALRTKRDITTVPTEYRLDGGELTTVRLDTGGVVERWLPAAPKVKP